MIAKNKGDFLYNLHNELHRIGIDDDEEIFADFEEHFKASQEEGFTEEETCEKLGDVKEIARNYLDIQSTRINSIVAGALENQRRVSPTKPGEKLPADLSLVGGQTDAAPAETPAIREYTPEHIAEETVPASPRINLVKPEVPAEAPREYTPEHIACEPEAPKAGPHSPRSLLSRCRSTLRSTSLPSSLLPTRRALPAPYRSRPTSGISTIPRADRARFLRSAFPRLESTRRTAALSSATSRA